MKNSLLKHAKKQSYLVILLLGIISFTQTGCSDQDSILQTKSLDQKEISTQEIFDQISEVTDDLSFEEVNELLNSASTRDPNSSCVCFTAMDLSNFLSCFGESSDDEECACFDFNENGVVDVLDMTFLLTNFGSCTNEIMEIDIAPEYFNYHQDIYGTGANAPMTTKILNSDCTWDDIKWNCSVEWYWEGILISTNKDKLNLYDAIVDFGALDCDIYTPLTLRITHNPSGRIFERTDCGLYRNNVTQGDLPQCDYEGCNASTFEFLTGPYDPLEFCINC